VSYQGGQDYYPIVDVDDAAEYTDMMGQASVANQAAGTKNAWMQSPTKSLLALWFFVLLTYWILGYFFRRYLA